MKKTEERYIKKEELLDKRQQDIDREVESLKQKVEIAVDESIAFLFDEKQMHASHMEIIARFVDGIERHGV